jgi:hypothetical protein
MNKQKLGDWLFDNAPVLIIALPCALIGMIAFLLKKWTVNAFIVGWEVMRDSG